MNTQPCSKQPKTIPMKITPQPKQSAKRQHKHKPDDDRKKTHAHSLTHTKQTESSNNSFRKLKNAHFHNLSQANGNKSECYLKYTFSGLGWQQFIRLDGLVCSQYVRSKKEHVLAQRHGSVSEKEKRQRDRKRDVRTNVRVRAIKYTPCIGKSRR